MPRASPAFVGVSNAADELFERPIISYVALAFCNLYFKYFIGLVIDYFNRSSQYDYLDEDFVARLSRISPITLCLGLIYVDRAKSKNAAAFQRAVVNETFLSALIVATKYLDEGVCNTNWAQIAGYEAKRINQLELEFLNLLVRC